MKNIFLCFAGGDSKWFTAQQRIVQQATGLNVFDDVVECTDIDLKNDKEFWPKHKEFIESHPKGFGLYIWKPYILKQQLEKLNIGDTITYIDSGCEIGTMDHIKYLTKFLNQDIHQHKIIGTQTQIEYMWTSRDLFEYMNIDWMYLLTRQRQGGTNMFLVTDKLYDLVEEWYNISCNYNLLTNHKPQIKNHLGFKGHRHDQSIFSLLTKKYGYTSWEEGANLGQCIKIRPRNTKLEYQINYYK